MPLTTGFNLREFIEPTIRDALFEDVADLKGRIQAKLSEILPENEFLVAITSNPYDSSSNAVNGTIYVKMDTGQFKALDFQMQPLPVNFDDVAKDPSSYS